MRTLTGEEIDKLEEYAKLLFSDRDLAVIMKMDAQEFRVEMLMETGIIYDTVSTARIAMEEIIRKQILGDPNAADIEGIPPDLSLSDAVELLRRMKRDNSA